MSKKRDKQRIAQAQAPKRGPIPVGKAPDGPVFVTFSFKHLAFTDKFCLDKAEDNYPFALLERLKGVSLTLHSDFIQPTKALRSHTIEFGTTSEPNGFGLHPQLLGTPWQFAVSANEHGRVHGFILGSVFHVVWIDPAHLLWPKT